MSKQTEALKLALEALVNPWKAGPHGVANAITAIREALAEQPAKQCWKCGDMDSEFQAKCTVPACGMKEQPAQRQEPVVWMYVNKSTHETKFQKHMSDFVDHSLWSEAPLYGEPLANHELQCVCGAVWCGDEMVHLPDKRPPASKPWVGLTEDEIVQTLGNVRERLDGNVFGGFARAIEAKLRENNA